METYWVIKSFYKSSEQYFFRPNDSGSLFYSDMIWSDNIWSSTKFESEESAIKQLKEGRTKYHWGGIYQIEKIFISR